MKLQNNRLQEIKVLIVGGCFPVQDNINEEDLYHQIMRKKIMDQYDIYLLIDILRYENIKHCTELIKRKAALSKPDLLLFHMRVEPVLPKVRLYNAYISRKGIIKRSIRMFSKIIFRISKVNSNSGSNSSKKSTRKFHSLMRELNYLSGILVFNSITLKKECLQLFGELSEYCRSMNIELIITGPVSRPRSYYENMISEQIDEFARGQIRGVNEQYISFLGLENEKKEFLFCEDLIKVNEAGHKRIADLILGQIIQNRLFQE